MDGLAILLVVIALMVAFGGRRSIAALQSRLVGIEGELRSLQAQIALLRPVPPETSAAAGAPPKPRPSEAPGPAEKSTSISGPAAAPPEPPPEPAPEPTPEPGQEPALPMQPVATATLEERLGTRWAVWVGGLALALGGVLLVRYSIEQGIFSPRVRVALGVAFSLVLLATGEWFRRTERASPVATIPTAHIPGILTAAGTISAFGTVYAAHALYQFIGPAVAFLMLGGIGIATMLAAALHGPALAGLGLAGALVQPLLIASQQPNPWPVVLYLAVVAAAAYVLARLRRWLWLASAVVAGAVVWGFALLAPADSVAPGAWALALFVHVSLQLALAAAFMAIEPHLATADAAAEPDWIATLALAALAIFAILALATTRTNEQWTAFAIVAMAVLALTAWRSAPAAAAGMLAGIVALSAIAVWPGLGAPPEPRLLAPALEGVLRQGRQHRRGEPAGGDEEGRRRRARRQDRLRRQRLLPPQGRAGLA